MTHTFYDIYDEYLGDVFPETFKLSKLAEYVEDAEGDIPLIPEDIKQAAAHNEDGIFLFNFDHHAPYDGCHWMTSHCIGQRVGDDVALYPIYCGNKKEFYNTDMYQLIAEELWKFDGVRVITLDDDAYKALNLNCLKTMHRILWDEFSFSLSWWCDGLEELTTEEPYMESGYTGDGGIGVLLTGWYSEDGHSRVHIYVNEDDDEQCHISDVLASFDSDDMFSWWDFDEDDSELVILDSTEGLRDWFDGFKGVLVERSNPHLIDTDGRLSLDLEGMARAENKAFDAKKAQLKLNLIY